MTTPRTIALEQVTVERRDAAGRPFRILDIAALAIDPGETIGIAGHSGAGKSMLMEVLSALTRPTSGRVLWGETVVSALHEAHRDRWRRQTIGFVFQDFHLIPELSALQNVLLPTYFAGMGPDAGYLRRARDLLARVDLTDPARPAAVLSRGEQQRVALARALLADPALILADEPTASLDAAAGRTVAELLVEAAREAGATLVVVSHDEAVLTPLARRLTLTAGRLTGDRAA